ncbi:hypothetical protein Scep_027398 [Stephania cephalantha]|uniref:Uncharacterized protein n=1 Tax=Stephania cephalantha TaxID=152367 RepID=A0AAP0E833_9MAGN
MGDEREKEIERSRREGEEEETAESRRRVWTSPARRSGGGPTESSADVGGAAARRAAWLTAATGGQCADGHAMARGGRGRRFSAGRWRCGVSVTEDADERGRDASEEKWCLTVASRRRWRTMAAGSKPTPTMQTTAGNGAAAARHGDSRRTVNGVEQRRDGALLGRSIPDETTTVDKASSAVQQGEGSIARSALTLRDWLGGPHGLRPGGAQFLENWGRHRGMALGGATELRSLAAARSGGGPARSVDRRRRSERLQRGRSGATAQQRGRRFTRRAEVADGGFSETEVRRASVAAVEVKPRMASSSGGLGGAAVGTTTSSGAVHQNADEERGCRRG